jgi:hypothetical protein
MAVEVTGPLDVDALVRALSELAVCTALTLSRDDAAEGEPTLVRHDANQHTLYLTAQDERSKTLLLNELRTIYADFAEGLPPSLIRRPVDHTGTLRPATVTRGQIQADVLQGLRTLSEHRGTTLAETLHSLYQKVSGDDCAFDYQAGHEPGDVVFTPLDPPEFLTRYRHHLTVNSSGSLVLVSAVGTEGLLDAFEEILANAANLCVEESF